MTKASVAIAKPAISIRPDVISAGDSGAAQRTKTGLVLNRQAATTIKDMASPRRSVTSPPALLANLTNRAKSVPTILPSPSPNHAVFRLLTTAMIVGCVRSSGADSQ